MDNEITPSITASAAPVSQTASEESVTTTTSGAKEHKPFLNRLKAYAWRATAFYVWLRLLVIFLGGGTLVSAWEALLISSLIRDLNWLGFVPTNESNLGIVLRAGWALAITGFNPWQLLGFLVYVYSFPVWYGFYLAFNKEVSQASKVASARQRSGLRPSRNRFPAVAVFGLALLGWYVLFGGTTRHRPIWAAVVLSGALMIALAYRAFQRAKPTSQADAAPLISMEKIANGAMNIGQQWEKHKSQTQSALLVTIKIDRWHKNALVYLAAFIRGKRGRDRVYALLVLQYALSLLLLLASAVLFWAFCIRVSSPAQFEFSRCLLVSVSHFLPGITPPPTPSELPIWVMLGPGFTAWILLGIYVGASASLLPGKQGAYAQRAQLTYALLRKGVVAIDDYIVRLRGLPQ